MFKYTTDSITCPEQNSKISRAISKFKYTTLVWRVHNIHILYTEGECPTPVCPVQAHCIKLWCNISIYSCLFWDKINTWQVYKKVSVNKHWLKATYFKLKSLWKRSQNWWKHCKIVSFCINTLDLHAPIIVMPHLPQVGHRWGLLRICKSFDKFPTPGDNFMLKIPYILYRDSKNNENS